MYSSENGNVGSWAEARDNNLIGKAAAADLEGIARLDGGLELVKVVESSKMYLLHNNWPLCR